MTEETMGQAVGGKIKKHGMWLIIIGILQVILGFFAMAAPLYAGLGVAIAVGIIFIMTGLFELFNSFKAPSVGWGIFRFLIGVLGIAVGIALLNDPVIGLKTLTIVLAVFFLIDGIDRLLQGIKLKGVPGSGWLIFGGIVSILVGIFIFVQWPLSNLWAVGVMAGIQITFGGWAKIMIGAEARSAS